MPTIDVTARSAGALVDTAEAAPGHDRAEADATFGIFYQLQHYRYDESAPAS